MPAQLDTIKDQADISRERNEEGEEAQWRLQIAKDNLIRITYSRKTCSQCHLAIRYSLAEKILHFQTSHTQDDAGLCFKCNFNKPSNLITLSCSTQLCESCLLELTHCNEREGLDHVWYFHFHIYCPFCHQLDCIDSDVATFFYVLCELPIPISESCPQTPIRPLGTKPADHYPLIFNRLDKILQLSIPS